MEKIKSQGEWLNIIKTGACNSCHALGTPGTRTISPEFGQFQYSSEPGRGACFRQARSVHDRATSRRLDTPRALAMFARLDRPRRRRRTAVDKPERPQGVERNVVVTLWDWGSPTTYLHDEISTDRRNPTRQRQRQDLRLDRRTARTTFRSSIR